MKKRKNNKDVSYPHMYIDKIFAHSAMPLPYLLS